MNVPLALRLARIVVALLALATASVSLSAQIAPHAEAVLSRADSALSGFTTVQFDASYTLVSIDGVPQHHTARIWLRREREDRDVGFLVRIELDHGWTITYDGKRILQMSTEHRKVLQSDSTMSMRQYLEGSLEGRLVAFLFMRKGTFSSLDSLMYAGADTTVDGTLCRVVAREYGTSIHGGRNVAQWCFGQSDHLPRLYTFATDFNDLPYRDTMRFARYDFDRPIPDSLFTIKTPEGFEFKVREPPKRPEPLSMGSVAPEFNLVDLNGDTVRLSDLRGKTVLIDFWYVACAPCLMAMPTLDTLSRMYRDSNVIVIGVNVRDDVKTIRDLITRKGFTYPLLVDGADVARTYRVFAYPTFYIVAGDGTISHHSIGFSETLLEDVRGILDKLPRHH